MFNFLVLLFDLCFILIALYIESNYIKLLISDIKIYKKKLYDKYYYLLYS